LHKFLTQIFKFKIIQGNISLKSPLNFCILYFCGAKDEANLDQINATNQQFYEKIILIKRRGLV
jgi:hypothetical protein